MGRVSFVLTLLVFVLLSATAEQLHAAFQFQKIAGTGTPLPGGGSFVNFGSAQISGDNIVFLGYDNGSFSGIYSRFGGGAITTVADIYSPDPSGGAFTQLGEPQIEGQTIVFGDNVNSGFRGLYTKSPGNPLAIAADFNTPAPGTPGNFLGFFPGQVHLRNGTLAFMGATPNARGIYTKSPGGVFTRIVDLNTPVPDSFFGSKFGYFLDFAIGPDGQSIAFAGGAPQGAPYNDRGGIYTNLGGGPLRTVANPNSIIPGTADTPWTGLSNAQIDQNSVFFSGQRLPTYSGLYRNDGGSNNTLVAGIGSPGPAGTTFDGSFGAAVLENGNILAVASDTSTNQAGYYARIDGQWSLVLRQNDLLDGKQIIYISSADLSGHQAVFTIAFSDQTQGIYTVTLPEPGTAFALAAPAAFALLRRRISLSPCRK